MKALITSFFYYFTPKVVLVKNIRVGILSRFIQLLIIGYIIGYAIVWKKGYQEFEDVQSAVTTKLKGVLLTNISKSEFVESVSDYSLYNRLWDITDLTDDSLENGAFYLMTNLLISPNQARSICGEDPNIVAANCTSSSDCPAGQGGVNGVYTGRCGSYDTTNTCEVIAWCPTERNIGPLMDSKPLFPQSQNFSILIKNFVNFPGFNVNRKNFQNIKSETYLTSCYYDPVTDPECPKFNISTIYNHLTNNDEHFSYNSIAQKGGIIAIEIKWDCNLDLNIDKCIPKYSFRRLDNPRVKIAPGWNYRYAHYYGNGKRTLYKSTGIKFQIIVSGYAGKFNIINLLLNIGAGLGLLVIEKLICDLVILFISDEKKTIREHKYQLIEFSERI